MKIDVVDFEVLDSVLSKLSFFERFTKSTRINILKLATYMKVDPGEYIFYQGDYGDNLYVILKGSITVKIDRVLLTNYIRILMKKVKNQSNRQSHPCMMVSSLGNWP